jgi:hypothetical protein
MEAFAEDLSLFVSRRESRLEPVVCQAEKLKAESGGRRRGGLSAESSFGTAVTFPYNHARDEACRQVRAGA